MECICLRCGKKFIPKTKNRVAKYCSFVCNGKSTGFKDGHETMPGVQKGWIKPGQRLSPNTEFKKRTGRWLVNGYVTLYMPNHSNARRDGSVLEHRVVLEKKIKRLLKRNEIAHHINGVKNDNRPENLEVMEWGEHSRHHRNKNK